MPQDLTDSAQVEQFNQAKVLLNRLLQSLDDANENGNSISEELKRVSEKRRLDFDKLAKISEDAHNTHETEGLEPLVSDSHLEESHIKDLELRRDLLMGRLQREEYLSSQYEDILDRHQTVMTVIKGNLRNRMVLEKQIADMYEKNVKDNLNSYEDNASKLDVLTNDYRKEYQSAAESVAEAAKNYNDILGEDEKDGE
ncbi:DEKNAAC102705 [Brettanomyces naardenensis]|uniref:DEKNAAC102705 n=1 Tax=Brettanomyces naardenensis TaxID=13370 RepID=A0A448YL28_BRENA|nr:DEKNAAC102705 [Brettanomyces naardenensis]